MSYDVNKIVELNYQLLKNISKNTKHIEKDLTDDEIIQFRKSLICDIIQNYSTWKNSFDCLYPFIKIGTHENYGVNLTPSK